MFIYIFRCQCRRRRRQYAADVDGPNRGQVLSAARTRTSAPYQLTSTNGRTSRPTLTGSKGRMATGDRTGFTLVVTRWSVT